MVSTVEAGVFVRAGPKAVGRSGALALAPPNDFAIPALATRAGRLIRPATPIAVWAVRFID